MGGGGRGGGGAGGEEAGAGLLAKFRIYLFSLIVLLVIMDFRSLFSSRIAGYAIF